MSLARAMGIVVNGVEGLVVGIEAYLAQGLPGMSIVGLGDTAVGESRDRVRAAVHNSGLPWPGERKITVSKGGYVPAGAGATSGVPAPAVSAARPPSAPAPQPAAKPVTGRSRHGASTLRPYFQ